MRPKKLTSGRFQGIVHLERELYPADRVPDGALAKVISDGTLKVDGRAMFVGIDPLAERVRTDRRGRVLLGLNCLVVRVGDRNVLIDAGVGNNCPPSIYADGEKLEVKGGKLLRKLREIGLTRYDIHDVILTHLHFDHAAGCVHKNRSGQVVPTFPGAVHHVRQDCWKEAETALSEDSPKDDYTHMKHVAQFLRDGLIRVNLIKGNKIRDLFHGVRSLPCYGHGQGNQAVIVTMGTVRIVFAGEVIPTWPHLELECVSKFDSASLPELINKQRREIVGFATGGIAVSSHDAFDPALVIRVKPITFINGDRYKYIGIPCNGYGADKPGLVGLRELLGKIERGEQAVSSDVKYLVEALVGYAKGLDIKSARTPYTTVGALIRTRRKSKNLSIAKLAAAAALDPSYVFNVERGKRGVSPAVLDAFSRALDNDPDELYVAAQMWPPSLSRTEETLTVIKWLYGEHQLRSHGNHVDKPDV